MPDTNTTILIVDDEADIRELIADNLQAAGMETVEAGDGLEALRLARKGSPDLILLDLMLPGMDGYAVLRELREDPQTARIPLIMITAMGAEEERIKGLSMGADDYVAKPFSPKEMVLRVQAVLRRARPAEGESGSLTHGSFRLDKNQLRLYLDEAEIDLTATEFKLLLCLMERSGTTLERAELLKRVWGYGDSIQTRTLDTHVKRLREKLEQRGDWIQTVRSVGYRFGPPSDDPA